ncbi:MAG: Helix-turn-helix domain [Holophagaceae bacterium]|nr:Helix-turn-helix domain [Holophagaceae bacterium]
MRAKKSSTEASERLSVSVEEAAEMLSIGRSSVFNLLNDGLLASLKVGKRRLIPVAELRAFLDRQARRAS